MARRNTKADRILNESAMRLEAARMRERNAQSQVNMARAVLEAVEEAHNALVKELASAPRGKPNKPTTATQGAKEPTADKKSDAGSCGYVDSKGWRCEGPADDVIHDKSMGYASYHEFEAAKPARKPRKKKEPPAVIPVSDQGIDGNGLVAEMES